MSDTGKIDVKDLPPGQHKITIDLVDGNHELFPGQSKTVTFIVPETGSVTYSTGKHGPVSIDLRCLENACVDRTGVNENQRRRKGPTVAEGCRVRKWQEMAGF